jgi:hypothetical protein
MSPAEKPTDDDASKKQKEEDDEPPPDAAADVAISRKAPWWDAGGVPLSVAFWGGIGIFIASLWRTTILPFVDYPQHLALAAILRRMISSGAPERALFETNLASYNSLFHIVVAGLNLIFPIHTAGKLGIAAYVVLTGVAVLTLLRATGRPRARAFLVMPVIMGYSIIWGFVNFGMGVAVQLLVLARVLERSVNPPDDTSPRWWRRPNGYDAITAGLAILGAYTHLLATALVYMLMLVAIVVRVQTEKAPLGLRLGRAVRTGLPLLPAIAYCAWVYRRQEAGYRNYEYASYEGNDVFAMTKVKEFFGYATGFRTDGLDAKIVSIGVGLLLLGALLRDPDDRAPPALAWLFVASLLAYFVIPHVFWATNFVFERISFLVVITAVVWAPRALPKYEASLRMMMVAVGVASAACFWDAMGTVGRETADLKQILDEAPKGRRVTGLVWHPKLESTMQWSMLHAPAYYVAQNGGEVAFSFTRTMSLPVHYRKETMPPDPPPNFEWNPQDYVASADYAKYFDLVLMKTTNDDDKDPRMSVWGLHWKEVDIVAHHGRWWIFETKRVSPDAISDPYKGFDVEGLPTDEGTIVDPFAPQEPPAPPPSAVP